MAIYDQKAKFSIISIVILISIFSILIIGCSFFLWTDKYPKINTIMSGLFTGLIIALCQLFQSWYEYRVIEQFKKMKVISIRDDRDDRMFYQNLLNNTKIKIEVMGVTAIRFVEHFADDKSDNPDTKVLFSAMARGVKVRFLLPKENYLESEKQIADSKYCNIKFNNIKQKFPNNFSFRYFDHPPAHSIFIIDKDCILGPVFPEVSSKYTPSIHLENISPYAFKYLEYFESEWDKAK